MADAFGERMGLCPQVVSDMVARVRKRLSKTY